MVWGHPDKRWVEGRDSEGFKEVHSCPRGCPGLWTEQYEPKKITATMLRDLGACESGIADFFEIFGDEKEVLVTKETADQIPNYNLELAGSWGALLLEERSRPIRVEYRNRRDRDGFMHTERDERGRCLGCVNNLYLFVELYNRG